VSRARRAYYAPNRLADAAPTAREEIRELVFSREEPSELPVPIETEARQTGGGAQSLEVVCRVDVR
jgi:hypothetical protein